MNGHTESGIGRRRGAARSSKSPLISFVVIAVSFSVTLLVGLLILGFPSSASTLPSDDHWKDAPIQSSVGNNDDVDELALKQFRKWADIIRGNIHLVSIETSGMISSDGSTKYQGVKGIFCKLDWETYKKDPPALPMFRMLVSASGCDKDKNRLMMDLTTVVQKAREYDKIRERRETHNADDVHVMPPAGFVFHESRVGSTLVANALTAMNPAAHRTYSESTPINEALKACQDSSSRCNNVEARLELFRDVVHLMGRTPSSIERNMFFKVSSIGAKRIEVMREAFPSVPWIFVYRDPVQAMMSHLDPAKIQVRGGEVQAVCTRAKRHPPKDLIKLAEDVGSDIVQLSTEEFCAAHLATLCMSALRNIKKSNGKGVAVEYEGLVDKLIQSIIPNHFGIDVSEAARQRILDVSKIYSKSKTDRKDWVEDSKKKDKQSTPEIQAASTKFLSAPYSELKKYGVE